MKTTLIYLSLIFSFELTAQTISWSGFPTSGTTYTAGVMTATVTKNNVTMSDGSGAATPKYYGSNPGTPCYTAGSLALYTAFFNSYTAASNSHVTVSMNFTSGGTTNGTCSSVQFSIKDINSGESFTDFLDVIEIAAIDGNNAAIPVANIVASLPASTAQTTSGSVRRIVGHNSTQETTGSFSSSPCNNTTVTITPPTGVALKSITIKYRPGYGTSISNAYYSAGTHPAAQYISISNLTLTPTGSGCVTLPIEMTSFYGACTDNMSELKWSTASELNNDYFLLEQSKNGVDFVEVAQVDGAGTSSSELNYKVRVSSELGAYYRLKQVDFDGHSDQTDVIFVSCKTPDVSVFPNPFENTIVVQLDKKDTRSPAIKIRDLNGKEVFMLFIDNTNQTEIVLDLKELRSGMYILEVSDLETMELISNTKINKL
ncbi:MAG: hypothetical protein RI922_607 [Bacteroidota bacterium]|jgi:hypothetical protein